MKIISIASLKGGVAKTTTTANMGYILSKQGKKVLLIDNDKQGNLSKTFDRYDDNDDMTVSKMFSRDCDITKIIKPTDYENIDIITANTGMIKACMELTFNPTLSQQLCFKKHLKEMEHKYDLCLIDNAPNVDIAVINSLACSNTVIIPVMVDQYALDGMNVLLEQIEIIKECFNNSLHIGGCLITAYHKRNNIDNYIFELQEKGIPVFRSYIKRTERKLIESTFKKMPITEFSPRCGATKSYYKFVEEFLQMEEV